MQSRVLVVIGPSGVGKSAIFSELRRENEIVVFPTWTTRAPRHYESSADADHVFVSQEQFLRCKQEKYFLETVQLFGLDCWYGLPHLPRHMGEGKIPVLMLRAMLLDRLASHIPNYIVYQVEAPYARVRAHLKQREHQDGSLGSRLESYFEEVDIGRRFASRIIDNSLSFDRTVALVREYLRQDFSQVTEPV